MKKPMIVGLLVLMLAGCDILVTPKFIAQGETMCEVNEGVRLFYVESYSRGKSRGTVVCRNGARFKLRY